MSRFPRRGSITKLTRRQDTEVVTHRRYDIVHTTEYAYAESVKSCVMTVCAQPRSEPGQQLLSFTLNTEPRADLMESQDVFGNTHHLFAIRHAHSGLKITSFSSVQRQSATTRPNQLDATAWQRLETWRDDWRMWQYLNASELTQTKADLDSWVRQHGDFDNCDPLSRLFELMRCLNESFDYVVGATNVQTTIDQFLERGEGVCQDFAHFMIAVARSWGIPSRYVSGYLQEGSGSWDRVARNESHAWVSCLLPELGWCTFDPTNPAAGEIDHVAVAYGRDYKDVAPTRGVVEGMSDIDMNVSVIVRANESAQQQ